MYIYYPVTWSSLEKNKRTADNSLDIKAVRKRAIALFDLLLKRLLEGKNFKRLKEEKNAPN